MSFASIEAGPGKEQFLRKSQDELESKSYRTQAVRQVSQLFTLLIDFFKISVILVRTTPKSKSGESHARRETGPENHGSYLKDQKTAGLPL